MALAAGASVCGLSIALSRSYLEISMKVVYHVRVDIAFPPGGVPKTKGNRSGAKVLDSTGLSFQNRALERRLSS